MQIGEAFVYIPNVLPGKNERHCKSPMCVHLILCCVNVCLCVIVSFGEWVGSSVGIAKQRDSLAENFTFSHCLFQISRRWCGDVWLLRAEESMLWAERGIITERRREQDKLTSLTGWSWQPVILCVYKPQADNLLRPVSLKKISFCICVGRFLLFPSHFFYNFRLSLLWCAHLYCLRGLNTD